MRQKSGIHKATSEKVVKDIRRATRKQYSAEEKIRIVLDGLRGGISCVRGTACPAGKTLIQPGQIRDRHSAERPLC